MSCCCCCFPSITQFSDEDALFPSESPSSVAFTEAGTRNLVSNTFTAPLEPPIPLSFPPSDLQTPSLLLRTQSNSGEGIAQTVQEKDTRPVGDLPDLDIRKPSQETRDECPICLEEYEFENPRLLTKCGHDFHLACILEWMERSEACPVCDKEIVLASS